MEDPRIIKAAKTLVEWSAQIKKNDYVQIITDPAAEYLALEVYKRVLQKGAYPQLYVSLPGQAHTYYKYASEEQLRNFPGMKMYEMKKTQAVISIGAPLNTRELSDTDPKRISMRQKTLEKLSKYRTEHTKWVIFYYPTDALAQEADMALTDFRDFVFKATNVDWSKTQKEMVRLKKILEKKNKIRVISKETDLTFSVKGRTFIASSGRFNMPDGELFTAPLEKSANGKIYYDFPAIYSGREVVGIRLEFKNGKVVKAAAEKNESFLKEMIKTDKGASYLGEFGIGMNYNIKRFVKNILFDEKIGGTVHFALGVGYKECGSKNKSAIHWDMIKDLRKTGEIYADGKLIYQKGKFII